MKARQILLAGIVLGGLGVAFGAFGAHWLEGAVQRWELAADEQAKRLATWEVAVRYQMYHALGLFAVAWALSQWEQSNTLLTASGWLFTAGILLFSGSLYALALGAPRWLGAIAPIGGVAFVLGWLAEGLP